MLNTLREKARNLPKVPGVYLMKDEGGHVLYIGKALNLPDRVSSYFIPSADLGPRKQPMLELITDFDTIECETEWEALLAENRLIKDIRPKFNSLQLDDKTFPYLVITLRDDFPGIFITRNPSITAYTGAKILGPFTSVTALRESIQLLQRVFKYRTCHLDILEENTKNQYFRPCLLYTIGQCTAPCANKIKKSEYREDINRFLKFIQSKRSIMLREMRSEMTQAAQSLNFEKAAVLRDQIKALEKLDNRGKTKDHWQPETDLLTYLDPQKSLASLQRTLKLDTPIRCLEGIDIAHLQGNETVGSKVCFVDGRPFKNEYRRYKITTSKNDDYKSIREVVSRRYKDAGQGNELYPDVILIDGGLGQLHAAQEVFEQLDIKPPMVISLAKKEELLYIQRESLPVKLGRENPGLRLCQAVRDEAHRFAQHYHHLLRHKKTLDQ